MSGIGTRTVAAAVVFGAAALLVGVGVSLSSADEPKTAQPPAPPVPKNFPPALPFAGPGADSGELAKAQEQLRRAMETLMKAPNDAAAREQLDAASRALMKALAGGAEWAPGPGFVNPARVPGRARLGVQLAPLSPTLSDQLDLAPNEGVAVAGVLEGSAAEKAGFKVHDVVIEFAGQRVTDPATFPRLVNDVKAGEKVNAVVIRKGKRTEVKGIELPATQPDALPMNPGATGRGAGDSVSVSVSDGAFTLTAVQDGVDYRITGKTGPAGAVAEKVSVKAGDEAVEATEIGKVPEKYRPTVEKLLKLVGKPREKVID